MTARELLARHAARAVALVAIALCYGAARLPTLSDAEERALARRFAFAQLPLAEASDTPHQQRRPVNPDLERHWAWISAVGAAVALADLDGDGLANDVCHVDPRTDLVTLAPAPGSGDRFALFALSPGRALFDADVMAPMGCVPVDANEDGRLDLLVYYWGRTPLLFLDRDPAPGPPEPGRYIAQPVVPEEERWYTNAATFADLDGDGHLDLLIGNYFQDGARILDASAQQADFMQHSMSRAYNGGRNRVLRWASATRGADPSVRFEEIEGLFEERAVTAWTLAIGAADLDGDLLPEVYFANDFGPDRLFHNRSRPGAIELAGVEGRRGFGTPRSRVLGGDSFKGMGVDFADLNGDGVMDFFVSNIAAEYALEESHFLYLSQGSSASLLREGVAPYEDLGEEFGVSRSDWGWDTRFGDFDNDGQPEALQATGFVRGEVNRWPELQELATSNDELLRLSGAWPRLQQGDDLSGHAANPFYVRAGDGRFYDLGAAIGIANEEVSRGIATADIDGDGDLDFAVANQWATSYLYRNERPARKDFLGLRLLHPIEASGSTSLHSGSRSPDIAARPAVGAVARVSRPDGGWSVAEVDGGNGHSGVRSPELHFGLGADATDSALHVEVAYRDRHGHPAQIEVDLKPGWHNIYLPDAPSRVAGEKLEETR